MSDDQEPTTAVDDIESLVAALAADRDLQLPCLGRRAGSTPEAVAATSDGTVPAGDEPRADEPTDDEPTSGLGQLTARDQPAEDTPAAAAEQGSGTDPVDAPDRVGAPLEVDAPLDALDLTGPVDPAFDGVVTYDPELEQGAALVATAPAGPTRGPGYAEAGEQVLADLRTLQPPTQDTEDTEDTQYRARHAAAAPVTASTDCEPDPEPAPTNSEPDDDPKPADPEAVPALAAPALAGATNDKAAEAEPSEAEPSEAQPSEAQPSKAVDLDTGEDAASAHGTPDDHPTPPAAADPAAPSRPGPAPTGTPSAPAVPSRRERLRALFHRAPARTLAGHVYTTFAGKTTALIKFDDRLAMIEPGDESGAISAYRAHLAEMRAELTAMPAAAVHATIRDAGIVGHLRDLDPEPHAWGGTSQLHRGTFADGEPVAVKLLHPSAWQAYPRELTDLLEQTSGISRHLPGLPVRAILESLAAAAGNDFNLPSQASRQHTFADALSMRAQPVPRLHVPTVRLVAPTLLVSSWATGEPLTDLLGLLTPEQEAQIAGTLAASVVASITHTGMLHADPHPGNVLVTEDGTVTLVDFAQCANAPMRLGDVTKALLGPGRTDETTALRALRSLALIPAKATVRPADALRAAGPLMEALDRDAVPLSPAGLADLAAAAGRLNAWGGNPAVTETAYTAWMWLHLLSRLAPTLDTAAALRAHLPGRTR